MIGAIYLIVNLRSIELSKEVKTLVVFAFIWALAQVLSDWSNNTAVVDSVKGTLAPLVFMSTIIFLTNYSKDKFQRIPPLLAGFALGGLLHLLAFPTDYFLYNPWKWGLGSAILSLFLIYYSFFYKGESRLFLFAVLSVFLMVALNNSGRSMAVFPILSAILYVVFTVKKSGFIDLLGTRFVSLKLVVLLLPILFLLNFGATLNPNLKSTRITSS